MGIYELRYGPFCEIVKHPTPILLWEKIDNILEEYDVSVYIKNIDTQEYEFASRFMRRKYGTVAQG